MKKYRSNSILTPGRKLLFSFALLLSSLALFVDVTNCGEIQRVTLSDTNRYTDRLEKGHFTREGTSGPGTGQFIGMGYEFAKGCCGALEKQWLSKNGWKADILGCGGTVLSADWCARYRSDHGVKYSLHFISWTMGSEGVKQRCKGDCGSPKRTVYERVRSH